MDELNLQDIFITDDQINNIVNQIGHSDMNHLLRNNQNRVPQYRRSLNSFCYNHETKSTEDVACLVPKDNNREKINTSEKNVSFNVYGHDNIYSKTENDIHKLQPGINKNNCPLSQVISSNMKNNSSNSHIISSKRNSINNCKNKNINRGKINFSYSNNHESFQTYNYLIQQSLKKPNINFHSNLKKNRSHIKFSISPSKIIYNTNGKINYKTLTRTYRRSFPKLNLNVDIKSKIPPKHPIKSNSNDIQQYKVASTNTSYNDLNYKFLFQSICGRSKKGQYPVMSRINQDRYTIQYDPNTGSMLLLVLDGHGEYGHIISEYIKNEFPKILFTDEQFKVKIRTSITSTLNFLQSDIIKRFPYECEHSGTTFVCAVIRSNTLYSVNIGDSKLMIIRQNQNKYEQYQLSIEHNFNIEEERSKIDKSRGIIRVIDDSNIFRLYRIGKNTPGINMSRSLGDKEAHSLGVSATPYIECFALNNDVKYILLCTDGVHQFMNNNEIMEILTNEDNYIDDNVDDLISESTRRWLQKTPTVDDITIIFGQFNNIYN